MVDLLRDGWLRLTSIRVRLTLWYALLLAFTLVGYSAILVVSLSRGLETGLDRVLTDGARQAIALLSAAREEQEVRDDFRRMNVGPILGLYDASGELIVGRSLPPPLDRPRQPSGSEPVIETQSTPDGTSWRILVQEINQPARPPRLLVVARSASFVEVAIAELQMLIAVTAPLVLLVAVAGGVFLAGRALNPIDHITRTAEAISAEHLSRRLQLPRTHDEVGRLAATLDHMLDRLDRAFEHQRHFTADASHELRTPLAMLVSRAGLALQRRRSVAEYEEVLCQIRDEGLHMGRIVNDLLMLARADAGETLAVKERLDAGELVNAVGDAMAPLAADRGIGLKTDAAEGLSVIGDQTRLTQLLVNLVENALAHTPAGGEVRVGVSRDGNSALLLVSDTGSGIAPEHLPHVFERFFRADRDRARDGSGAGLGLALCLSIARAHGGDIRIDSDAANGTRVTVLLPLDRSAEPARASDVSYLSAPASASVSSLRI